uniref:MULE transposase domain-containing protein n=1 Tax=Setaria italica TaxID=4555 RepID=K3ZE85_SETIT
MAPTLRRKVNHAPSYGDKPDDFTVQVHHGGFFVGFGHLRSYVVGKVSCDNEDSDFWDSENELDDDDDDLFVDHVDKDVMDEGIGSAKSTGKVKKAKGSRLKVNGAAMTEELSTDDEEEELLLPNEDRDAQVNIKNERKRIRAHCADGCPWALYASYDSRVKAITIKIYVGGHNCQNEWVLKRCTTNWLADKYLDSFRANDKMSISNFARTVQKDWNLTPSRSKLARARRIAMKTIFRDDKLRKSNRGTSFFLNLSNGHFSTCYMSLDPCKRGFLSGCRPLICLDGCHIKTKFGGLILTAVAIGPNDFIYPIALAVVEVESKASWKWLLETLKQDLDIGYTFPWTIMTDKQKGLIPAVQEVFPESEHRFCVRHLYSNFKDRMPTNTWVRAYFYEFPKSDILLNNNCEVFNKYILEGREMPILSMFERIKQQLMTRYYNKQKELAEQFVSNICSKIRKKVAKNAEFANVCYALPAEKKIGRSPRCRRKPPCEIQGTNGPKLSKHGVIITCSYCKQDNHNAKGCSIKKMGIRPEDYIPDEVEHQEHEDAEPENQEPQMGSQSTSSFQPPRPLPDSTFISSNIPVERPALLTTATKQGKVVIRKRK